MRSLRLLPALAAIAVCAHASLATAQHPAPLAEAHGYSYPATSLATLHAGFEHPPADARPMVRWWWFGPAVVKPEIARELAQMKADGIGGAELAFVYPEVLDDPAKNLRNLSWLSPEMLDAVTFAQAEGKRLGLRIDVTLCSGWPYGGPHITAEEAARRLRLMAVPLPVGATSLPLPKLAAAEEIVARFVAKGDAKTWDPSSAKAVTGDVIAPATAGQVALLFIDGHTGQQVKRAAVDADGPVLDPFSRKAVANHLKTVGEPLVKAFGATPPYAIFSDSLEAYGADWTPTLPEEFKKRRGYDLIPHLPELWLGGTEAAAKVRHDWGITLTELINENYLTQINDWAREHKTRFRSQTYGEPAVSLSSERLVDLAEGEGPQWRAFSTLRWATSANHLNGRTITSGETFTWLHSPVFRATPLDMKAEADIDFLSGENLLIFHGWPYSPPKMADGTPEVPEPGWSLYAAAVFNDHNPWHPVMPTVTDYISRMSWLLRQGKPANQVALLLPTDDAWAAFMPGKVSVTAAMQQMVPKELMSAVLSAGYNIDFIDAETINRQGLGDHTLLLLPPSDRIPTATLKAIDTFVERGGHAVAMGKLPTLDPDGKPLPDAMHLTQSIALTPDAGSAAKALVAAMKPDLAMSNVSDYDRGVIGFIRRSLRDADVYFVANTSNQTVKLTADFTTKFAGGQEWSADSAMTVRSIPAHGVDIELAPYQSRVYVFGNEAVKPATPAKDITSHTLAEMDNNWTVRFAGTGATRKASLPSDWNAGDTQHYSGEVVYSQDVTLNKLPGGKVFLAVDGGSPEPGAPNAPAGPERTKSDLLPDGTPNPLVTRPGPGTHAWYLAPIREAALVTINGKPTGALWHPPYRLDVTSLLKPGVNHIEIHVYNTAFNAWSALPPHDFKPLIAKYGDRFQMQELDKVKPLPSGILGTVKLETETR
ncbi:alpha-L-rhamnosidase [Bryocella elongata]|uniref:Alpha-L-rhamnosidase n=1 Tax=Bryocella elongata TaxID=863522 RepID=A0A1H5VZ61_9BACT|nr:glycosyl hydrolase [Bryocella elongata]SEF92266.1 alpha-L-rhamnosidase [Bryocella elongata]